MKTKVFSTFSMFLLLATCLPAQVIIPLEVPPEMKIGQIQKASNGGIITVYNSGNGVTSVYKKTSDGNIKFLFADDNPLLLGQKLRKPQQQETSRPVLTVTPFFLAGDKSLYFTTFCPPDSFNYCASWRLAGYSRLERLVMPGDQILFKTLDGKIRKGKVAGGGFNSFPFVFPSLDGERELFSLAIDESKETRDLNVPAWFLYHCGVFEKKTLGGEVIFEHLTPSKLDLCAGNQTYCQGGPIVTKVGIWLGSSGQLLFGIGNGIGGYAGDRLIAHNLKTNKRQTLIQTGERFENNTVNSWSLYTDLESYEHFVTYTSGTTEKLLKIQEGSFFEITSTERSVEGWGKFAEIGAVTANKNLGVIAIWANSPSRNAVGFFDPYSNSNRISILIKDGDNMPDGGIIKWSNEIFTPFDVRGCSGDFLNLDLGTWTAAGWYKVTRPCIKNSPASVNAGQEIFLEGDNFSPAPGAITEVLINGIPSRPTSVSNVKIGAIIPETGDYTLEIKTGYLGRNAGSNLVKIKVLPPLVPPSEILAITNGASFDLNQPLAPGEIFSLFGKNLGTAESARAWPLPRKLGGAKITICGVDAPLFLNTGPMTRMDGGGQLWQINGVVPGIAGLSSTCEVVVTVDQKPPLAVLTAKGTVKISSEPEKTLAIFTFTGFYPNGAQTQEPIITNQQGQLIAPPGASIPGADPAMFTQARACEVISLWTTGGGGTIPPVADGEPALSEPLAWMGKIPVVQIYGMDAQVLFAGLAPGFAGLYQINVKIPCEATSGEQWLWFGRLPNPGKAYKIWIQ